MDSLYWASFKLEKKDTDWVFVVEPYDVDRWMFRPCKLSEQYLFFLRDSGDRWALAVLISFPHDLKQHYTFPALCPLGDAFGTHTHTHSSQVSGRV